MKALIYFLSENEIPFYIGKTIRPKWRKSSHKRNFPNASFEILDEIPNDEWKFWESHYISVYH